MINIVTVKWGDKYDAAYVNKLYASIKRNTTLSFRFHCFTEDSSDLNPNVFAHDLPYTNLQSWWNKLYLFSNEILIPKGEKIFYVDLDTLITDNIEDLLQQPANKITVLRDFLNGIARTAGEMGSGLMMWRHGEYEHIWTEFTKNPSAAVELVHPHGDQHWIDHCVSDRFYWQELLPNRVVSFKVHCREGLPKNAAIVCYHGRPSITEYVHIN
jgi:lipopolysaccharide biosynthesis glycosyltransferase